MEELMKRRMCQRFIRVLNRTGVTDARLQGFIART
jgi:hypothetical protein